MYTRVIALSDALPALRSLFVALAEQRERDRIWGEQQLASDPEMTRAIVDQTLLLTRDMQFTIAGSIVLIADGILKKSARDFFGEANGESRKYYGTEHGVPFGEALLGMANVFRHHDEWSAQNPPRAGTARVLALLGFAADISACLDVLDRFDVETVEDLTRELDIAANQMENGALCACGHPALFHKSQVEKNGESCSFLIAPQLPDLRFGVFSDYARCTCAAIKKDIKDRP